MEFFTFEIVSEVGEIYILGKSKLTAKTGKLFWQFVESKEGDYDDLIQWLDRNREFEQRNLHGQTVDDEPCGDDELTQHYRVQGQTRNEQRRLQGEIQDYELEVLGFKSTEHALKILN